MKIDKRVYKYIEYELHHYSEYKNEIRAMREEILEGSPEPPDGQPRGNATSNPTESKAMKLSVSVGLISMEKVVRAVDTALELLTDRHKRIFEMMYINKRRDRYGMSDELHISYEMFNINRRELVISVGRELGVIKEF